MSELLNKNHVDHIELKNWLRDKTNVITKWAFVKAYVLLAGDSYYLL